MKFIAAMALLLLLAFAALFFASLYVVLAPPKKPEPIEEIHKEPTLEPLGECHDVCGIEVQQGILMS